MNCENRTDIDAFIQNITECSDIQKNGLPDCINRLILVKEQIKMDLKEIEPYLYRLLDSYYNWKIAQKTDVKQKIIDLKDWIDILKDFFDSTTPRTFRKERMQEVFKAFKEILKLHQQINKDDFIKLYNWKLKYAWLRIKEINLIKILTLIFVTVPLLIWGLIEAYQWIYSKFI